MKPDIEALPSALEDLFAAERSRPGPSPRIADQMAVALQVAIAAAPVAPLPGAGSAAVAKGVSSMLVKFGVVAVGAFVAGGVSGAALYAKVVAVAPAPQIVAAVLPIEAPAPVDARPATEERLAIE